MTKIDHEKRNRQQRRARAAGTLLHATFPSKCSSCARPIEQGQRFFYTPYGRYCTLCGPPMQ